MRAFRLRDLGLALLPLCLAGCLTIEEHYSFRKNGSGTVEYVVDLSSMGAWMKGLDGTDKKKGGADGLGAMGVGAQAEAIRGIPGIGKVKLDTRMEWVQRLSFAFRDLNALNAALNKLMPDSSGTEHVFFHWAGDTLVRTNNRHAHELGTGFAGGPDTPEENGDEDGGFDLRSLLGEMKYRYSFRFAGPVADVVAAPGMTRTGRGAREVELGTDFIEIGRDRAALDLRIALGGRAR